MDTYALSFTLPRAPSGHHAFLPDTGPSPRQSQQLPGPSTSIETALNDTATIFDGAVGSGRRASAESQRSLGQRKQQQQQSQEPPIGTAPQPPAPSPESSQSRSPQQQQSATHAPTGRLGSMRSRFPPSVKAFMPMAFGGKRASERIAEVTSAGEKEDDEHDASLAAAAAAASGTTPIDRLARSSAEWRKSRLKSTSSLPLSVPEEGAPVRGTGEDPSPLPGNSRDSRSTAGTRSSLDFSSIASFSVDSTAPSTANGGGSRGWPGKSEPPSVSHSASGSITAMGTSHPLTSIELAEAAQRLSLDVMSSTQCVVSCSVVPDEGSGLVSAANPSAAQSQSQHHQHRQAQQSHAGASPYGLSSSHQLPFPSGYPHQHYAQGFGHGHELNGPGSGAFSAPYPGTPGSFMTPLGNPAAMSSASLASSLSQQPGALPSAAPAHDSSLLSAGATRGRIPLYNFHLTGQFQQVMEARSRILREHPFRSRVSLKIPRADLLEQSEAPAAASTPSANTNAAPSKGGAEPLKPQVRAKLDEIAHLTNTHIAISGKEARGTDLGYGLETERSVNLVISGKLEGVEFARIKVLVMLDELAGLTSTTFEIDQKFHNIIGGRKRVVLQTIQEQTATSIYLPLPFAASVSAEDPALQSRQSTIHITGDLFGVQRARDMLFQVFVHKSKCTISRDTAILPRKIDWLLNEHLDDLRQIMVDNGTYVGLPALGSQSSVVSVYGDNRVNIERSIRTIMALACQFYVASVWLLPVAYNALASPASINAVQLTPVLKAVASRSGAEVVFKSNCFEIHGLEAEVKSAVGMILDLDVVKQFNFEVRFQIELAASEREFLQGRKCGKVNKIMKQCGVRIKFETFNDYNFLIELSSNDRASALQGLALLQEELPAEVSFHVPEAYHKRCIGVGGKQIQKVMKKYGVYVKFSNAEEFSALGGYIDNDDNVIARTPAKNAINLENLKQSVMEMVNPKDKDYTTETVSISRCYHRTLLGEKGIFIHDIENKCSSKVLFPPRETASDMVSIFGPESQIHIASAMLLEHVPFDAEFRTPNAPTLMNVVKLQDFRALTDRVKRDLNISIEPVVTASAAEAVFKLRLSRSNSDFLPTAKDLLEDFLVSRNINVYAAPARARSDSFASSFPHFATKLISTPTADNGDASSFHGDLAARFNESTRLRPAASSPALKALFDSPAGHPPFAGHSGAVTGGFPTPPAATSSLPPPPGGASASPLVGSSLYSSPYVDSLPGGVGSDVWGTPRNVMGLGQNNPAMPQPSAGMGTPGGISFPQHFPRQSDDAGLLSKGTDPFGVDERMRQLRRPRSFAHRAQSLDISSLGSQQAALEAAAAAQHGNGLYSSSNHSGNFGAPGSGAVNGTGAYTHHAGAHLPPSNMPRIAHGTQSMSQAPSYPHPTQTQHPHVHSLPHPHQQSGPHQPQHHPSLVGGGSGVPPHHMAGPVDDMTRMFGGITFPPS
ncbi:unnamed protein product [Parajaminaea phylloscopi]